MHRFDLIIESVWKNIEKDHMNPVRTSLGEASYVPKTFTQYAVFSSNINKDTTLVTSLDFMFNHKKILTSYNNLDIQKTKFGFLKNEGPLARPQQRLK